LSMPAPARRLRMLTSQVCGGSLMVAAKPSTSGLRLRGRPVRVDELMMGCAFINSKGEPGATVSAAWKAGITSFDTAAAYGESEARLGEALAAAGITDEATVITKVRGDPGSEPRFTQMDQTAAAAAHTLAVSKSTMGLKRIHTLRFHDADDARITEAVKPGGLVAGLRTFDSAMLAYGWNLQNQSSLPILLEAEKRGIEIHPAGEFEPLLASCGWSLVTLPYRGPCHRGVFLQRLREFVRPVQNRGRRSPGEAHKVGRPC
jgi:hypothetical protein